ncbi:MAG TPA: TldD/PmbA family protein [Methylomirabilota bacterium]|nr:TldD/PmbA family protein [Methylomirabilota bacterium]
MPARDSRLTDLVHLASSRGATYADARSVERENETVSLRDGGVEAVTRAADRGVGFRVIHKGGWGFAATDRTDEGALKGLVDEAFRRAEASASTRSKPVTLAPIAPQKGEYRTSLKRDPFSVPMKERLALLTAADAALLGPNAKSRRASVAAYRTRKRLVTSEGTDVSQEIVESGAGVAVTAAKGGAKPAQRYDSRLTRQAGWEFIEELDLVARATRYRDDAEATLDAPLAEEKPTTLVFAPEFLALLVHESCGHPTEADRVLEYEVAFAGTTFMWPNDRSVLHYGSPHVSITADATLAGGMGTFGWDDDGVPAMKTKLIDKGVFRGYLTSRETAAGLGLPVAIGSARAEGWQHFPIVRMVNVSLDPGTQSYPALLAGVERGLLLEAPASYSLDDKRQNFHFSTQAARVIRNGQLEGYVRGVAFQSLTPAFWGRCDGVADDWELHGFLSCAKGEPLQLMRVGHGAAHARFRDVPIEVRD